MEAINESYESEKLQKLIDRKVKDLKREKTDCVIKDTHKINRDTKSVGQVLEENFKHLLEGRWI